MSKYKCNVLVFISPVEKSVVKQVVVYNTEIYMYIAVCLYIDSM